MKFRVASDLYVKVISKFLADEADQFIGILEWARPRHTFRPVTAENYQTFDPSVTIGCQDSVQQLLVLGHTGNMRSHRDIGLCRQVFNGVPGCLQGGAARSKSHGQVIRFQRREFLPGRLQYQFLFRRPWRKELK